MCRYFDVEGKPTAPPKYTRFRKPPFTLSGTPTERDTERTRLYLAWFCGRTPELLACVDNPDTVFAAPSRRTNYYGGYSKPDPARWSLHYDYAFYPTGAEAVTICNVRSERRDIKHVDRSKYIDPKSGKKKYKSRTRWETHWSESDYPVSILLPGYFTKPWRHNASVELSLAGNSE